MSGWLAGLSDYLTGSMADRVRGAASSGAAAGGTPLPPMSAGSAPGVVAGPAPYVNTTAGAAGAFGRAATPSIVGNAVAEGVAAAERARAAMAATGGLRGAMSATASAAGSGASAVGRALPWLGAAYGAYQAAQPDSPARLTLDDAAADVREAVGRGNYGSAALRFAGGAATGAARAINEVLPVLSVADWGARQLGYNPNLAGVRPQYGPPQVPDGAPTASRDYTAADAAEVAALRRVRPDLFGPGYNPNTPGVRQVQDPYGGRMRTLIGPPIPMSGEGSYQPSPERQRVNAREAMNGMTQGEAARLLQLTPPGRPRTSNDLMGADYMTIARQQLAADLAAAGSDPRRQQDARQAYATRLSAWAGRNPAFGALPGMQD